MATARVPCLWPPNNNIPTPSQSSTTSSIISAYPSSSFPQIATSPNSLSTSHTPEQYTHFFTRSPFASSTSSSSSTRLPLRTTGFETHRHSYSWVNDSQRGTNRHGPRRGGGRAEGSVRRKGVGVDVDAGLDAYGNTHDYASENANANANANADADVKADELHGPAPVLDTQQRVRVPPATADTGQVSRRDDAGWRRAFGDRYPAGVNGAVMQAELEAEVDVHAGAGAGRSRRARLKGFLVRQLGMFVFSLLPMVLLIALKRDVGTGTSVFGVVFAVGTMANGVYDKIVVDGRSGRGVRDGLHYA